MTRVGDGHVDRETTDEHLRVWLGPLDRWRIESEDRIDLRNGATRWTGGRPWSTSRITTGRRWMPPRSACSCTPGAHLLGVLRFEAPVDDVVAGRRCWKARATTDPGCQTFRPIPFGLRLAGIEHTFWFDRETGIVLRHLGSVDSRPCSMVEFKEVWVNPFIEEGIFEFEPSAGTLVHRRTDHLIRMAERAGADLVESVKFLRADEVVVWFSVAVDGRRLEAASRLRGRAVRLGSAWMVEHATFADLVRPTGVEVPPPEDAERS